ncbi:hypothetical protein Hypma_002925 [Hypsizygus marmoreus]|uniref:Uncharacterized protein n=1 Tax=Hypsizygus marmoreus TaxID=39966 RepID=A0A369J9L5_HYPMA|nr:hypothetical protein Hypma_002925 [Hypsizygus marmoreus]
MLLNFNTSQRTIHMPPHYAHPNLVPQFSSPSPPPPRHVLSISDTHHTGSFGMLAGDVLLTAGVEYWAKDHWEIFAMKFSNDMPYNLLSVGPMSWWTGHVSDSEIFGTTLKIAHKLVFPSHRSLFQSPTLLWRFPLVSCLQVTGNHKYVAELQKTMAMWAAA